jgi:methionyl-tRNA synthetase
MMNRPERTDTEFSWDDFQKKNNAELVGNLGNLVNRTVVFLNRNYDGIVPEFELNEKDEAVPNDIRALEKKIGVLIETIDIKEAIKEIMHISKIGNQYLQDNEPWKNPDKMRNSTTLSVLANIVKDLAILIRPYMPLVADSIKEQLNIKTLEWNDLGKLTLHPGHKISQAQLVFKKIEDKDVKELREKFSGKRKKEEKKVEVVKGITINDVQLRVAKIVGVERHPNAEKLYIEKLDLGDEYRTIVSGLVPYYSAEELLGRNIIVVANLEPANLRGVESCGMLLAAEENGVVGLVTTHGEPGDYVYTSELDLERLKNLPRINIKEFSTVKIFARDKKIICDDSELRTKQGLLSVERVSNGNVR